MDKNSQLENSADQISEEIALASPTSPIKTVISIVTYNALDHVKECISSLEWTKRRPEIEIFVVDNDSSEPVMQYLKTQSDWLNARPSGKNGGLSYGHNEILKQCESLNPQYILVLNPDCLITENTYNGLVEQLDKPVNNKVGIIGPKILDSKGAVEPTILKEQNVRNTGLPLALQLLGVKQSHISVPESGIHKVNALSGACLLIRKTMIDEIGYFDTDFFMYYEDHDFGFRAKKAGWDCLLNADVIVKHYIGASSEKSDSSSDWKNEMMFKSLLIYFDKNCNWLQQRLLKLGWIFGLSLRVLLGRRKESNKKLLKHILNFRFH